MLCSLSNLSEDDLKEINHLESEISRTLLAYSCQDVRPAQLTDEEMERIQSLEKKLGISLVAVESGV